MEKAHNLRNLIKLSHATFSQKDINVLYQNVKGLRTKTRQCFLSTQSDSFDIYFVTETWLTDSFQNSELFPTTYNVFRSDNLPNLSDKSRGGGALIAIKNCFNIIKESVAYNTQLTDAIFVHASIHDVKLLLCCVYIPPSSPINEYLMFYDFYSSITDTLDPTYRFLICGDFNLPKYVTEYLSPSCSRNIAELLKFCNEYSLSQFNYITNVMGRILDLIVSSMSVNVKLCPTALVRPDPLHPPIQCNIKLKNKTVDDRVSQSHMVYDFPKADLEKLNDTLEVTDFSTIGNFTDVNKACGQFYDLIYSALNKCVPKKLSKLNAKYPVYYTKRIIARLTEKNKLFRKISNCKRIPAASLIGKYKHLRRTIKSDIKKAYSNYASNCESVIRNDPRKVWQFTSSRLDKKNATPSTLFFNDVLFTEPQDIADKFASLFSNIYVKDDETNSSVDNLLSSQVQFSLLDPVAVNEVKLAIKKLKQSKCAGPDNIPQYIVKKYADVLSKPLSQLFNLCLRYAIYPHQWKVSSVTPIFKKGDRSKGENYRAVCMLNCFSKCFEIVLTDRLFSCVKCSIVPEQHGFFKGRSTVTNLSVFTCFVADALSKKQQVDTVYFDFKSAFDLVNHALLLQKLIGFDIPPYLIALLKSYLSGRFQFVSFRGCRSNLFPVYSGVPQGSHLGPLLFLIFINDLCKFILWAYSLIFADDLKIYKVIQSLEDCINLQKDIDNIALWASRNKMTLHSGKCEVMQFGRGRKFTHNYILNGVTLKISESVKDLGIYFSDNLSFKHHITNAVSAANKTLGFIIRMCHHFRNISTFKLLFSALVRSKLEYGCVVWNPIFESHNVMLERVQKRFLRYIYFRIHNIYPHYKKHPVRTSELLDEFKMIPLKARRELSDGLFFFKVIDNVVDCAALLSYIGLRVNIHNTRQRDLFITDNFKQNPLMRMAKFLNTIDIDPFNVSVSTFRQQLYRLC